MHGRLLNPRASSYKVAPVRISTGDEAHLNRIHCDADGFYLGLPTGLLGRSLSPFESPMMVLEHGREPCLQAIERRSGAMDDLMVQATHLEGPCTKIVEPLKCNIPRSQTGLVGQC